MIDRQKGNIVWSCDFCSDAIETETSDFDAARDMLKREGWVSVKDGDEWKHFCSDCKSASRLREG